MNLAKNLLVIFALAIFYIFLRYPLSHITLPFYDDGETLYHTLSVLKGGVPYKDDYTHHFLGYIIPYLLLSKVIGFSVDLTPTLAVLTQALTGWGVFLILNRFTSPGLSFLGALLLISAREPWVLGFFVQYQYNLLIVFVWYLLIRYLNEGLISQIIWASLLVGFLLISDQRVLFVGILPLLAVWIRGESRSLRLGLSSIVIALPIILALNYLWSNGALKYFIEQTILFPIVYRSGSATSISFLSNLYQIHRYLWEDTPILFTFGILGLLVTLRNVFRYGTRGASFFLLLAGMVQATIPLLGGRDYDYYTIPWLPWLTIMTIVAGDYLILNYKLLRKVTFLILVAPLILSISGWVVLTKDEKLQAYKDDGAEEVVERLREYIDDGEKIFVWGYRLDLYVRLNVRSAYMFANNLSIHPDPQITDPQDRMKHIAPLYEDNFLSLLRYAPPNILVFFTLNGERHPSRSDAELRLARDRHYNFLFKIERRNFRGDDVKFEAYRLRSLNK